MTLLATILIGLVAALVGGFIGYIYANRGTDQAKRNNALQERFDATEQELQRYQMEVTAHFKETAKVVDDLTEAYRNVHNHLAVGASQLTPPSLDEPLLKTLPGKEELDAISTAPVRDEIQPPLDYAPKTSINRVGMLDESYGLETEEEDQLQVRAEH